MGWHLMTKLLSALALACAIALPGLSPATAAELNPFASLATAFGFGGFPTATPAPEAQAPPPDAQVPPLATQALPPVAQAPVPDVYVPVAPPGMVTYPGYAAAYPNTGCRGAYWARKPIFNADGLLVGYTRPQYVCPNWY
jgi:hypothetical protein